ncbi:MAG: response regulator [Alphaproteobacteria bacterium]|nr:response regulator [Alphaproteobacteria bacterium]
MFNRSYKKLLQSLLESDDSAIQVRSFNNRVIIDNAQGNSLFGTGENPFLFLKEATPKGMLEQLSSAYIQHTPYQMRFYKKDNIVDISLTPITKAMLIQAAVTPKQADAKVTENIQLTILSEALHALKTPVYMTDMQGEILYVNPAFCEQIDYKFQDLLGQFIGKVLPLEEVQFLPFYETDIQLSTPMGSQSFYVSQYQIKAQEKTIYCGNLVPTQIPALNLNTPIDSIPFAQITITVNDLSIVHKNTFFTELFPASTKSLTDILTEQSCTDIINKLTKSHRNLDSSKPVEVNTLDNRTFFLYPIWHTTGHDEATLFFIEITTNKALETQTLQSHKMQAIGQLAGGIAHDFNNLLTAIIGFTDLLLQKHPVGDDSFGDLMQIKGNATRAGGLVGQLLTFSRKTPVQNRYISVHDAFVDLSALLERALAPHCTLKMDFARHLGCIQMDANQLTQIFLNLAVNAKDAMKQGGLFTVTLTKEKVKKAKPCGLDTLPAGDYIKITATDTGSGIDANVLPHIFEPFFTTKKKSAESGTGLGLSTVYGIIHSVGGYIKADSVPNVGTTFTIYLPRFDEVTTETISAPQEIQNVFLPPATNPILLVDDEDGIRTITARALKTKGFEVMECANAEQAITHLKKHPQIQLLLTDMVMPGMDGETLIHKIKELQPHLPCLLMSGYSDAFEKHTSDAVKDFDFISKPFTLADLLNKVKEILERK